MSIMWDRMNPFEELEDKGRSIIVLRETQDYLVNGCGSECRSDFEF
jgi:hypothetical protein